MIDALAVFLTDNGINSSQFLNDFMRAVLKGFVLSWPVWVAVGLLALGYLIVGIVKRIVRRRSRGW